VECIVTRHRVQTNVDDDASRARESAMTETTTETNAQAGVTHDEDGE